MSLTKVYVNDMEFTVRELKNDWTVVRKTMLGTIKYKVSLKISKDLCATLDDVKDDIAQSIESGFFI